MLILLNLSSTIIKDSIVLKKLLPTITVKNLTSTILYSQLSYLFDEHENLLIKNPKNNKKTMFKFLGLNLKK